MKKPAVRRLIEALGGRGAADRYRASLAALDAEDLKLADERTTLEAEMRDLIASGEDAAAQAARLVELEKARRAIEIRREPLSRLIAEAEEAENARAQAERRAAWEAALAEKRKTALTARVAAVGALREAAACLARLDVLEREAERLGDKLGTFGLGFDATPDAIAKDASALVLEEMPGAEPGPFGPPPIVVSLPRLVLPADLAG